MYPCCLSSRMQRSLWLRHLAPATATKPINMQVISSANKAQIHRCSAYFLVFVWPERTTSETNWNWSFFFSRAEPLKYVVDAGFWMPDSLLLTCISSACRDVFGRRRCCTIVPACQPASWSRRGNLLPNNGIDSAKDSSSCSSCCLSRRRAPAGVHGIRCSNKLTATKNVNFHSLSPEGREGVCRRLSPSNAKRHNCWCII